MLKKSAYSQKFIESALTQPMKSGLIRSVARIAQSVEQGIENPRVLGSIPSPGTTYSKNPPKRRVFALYLSEVNTRPISTKFNSPPHMNPIVRV